MKFAPLLLFVFAWVTACGPEPKTSSATPAAGPAAQAASKAAAPATPEPTPPTAKTTYQQLQGKWQSTTDARSVIEIKEHQYIDYYDGKQLGTAAFILDRACPGAAGAGHPGDNEKYLVEPKEDMCWEIVGVNEAGLELSYTARGNTLNYRRMK
jgi:hypothetical protein